MTKPNYVPTVPLGKWNAKGPVRDRKLKRRKGMRKLGARADFYDSGGNLKPQFKNSGLPLTSLAYRHPAATDRTPTRWKRPRQPKVKPGQPWY